MTTGNQSSAGGRKISTTMIVFAACVLGLGIGLFGINYYHATKCASDRSPDELEDLIQSLTRRLLEAESQIHKNEILLNKVFRGLQTNLFKLEQREYEELIKISKDEAVKTALYLASHPAPPMPEFELESQFEDAEKLADVIDDVFGKEQDDKSVLENMFDGNMETQEEALPQLTDSEAGKVCSEWKEKYNVIVGVSWGDLPYDLQQKWLAYSCDYHMKEDKSSSTIDGGEST